MNKSWVASLAAAGAVVVLLSGTAGCRHGLVPVTQEMRLQHQLTDDDLKNLQYYVSHDIVLRRELESGGRQVTGSHKLVVIAGKMIEEVEIPKHTPGVAMRVEPDRIWVSFEQGTELPFTLREGGVVSGAPTTVALDTGPNADPFPGNRGPRDEPDPFPGSAASGGGGGVGNFWLTVEPGARQVMFGGKAFEAIGRSFASHLLIDADELEEVEETRRVLPGVRLSQ